MKYLIKKMLKVFDFIMLCEVNDNNIINENTEGMMGH